MQRFFFCHFYPASRYEAGVRIKFYCVTLGFFFLLHTGTVLATFFLSFDKIFISFVLEIWAFHEACHFAFLLLNTSFGLLDKERNTCNAVRKIFSSLLAIWFCLRQFTVLVLFVKFVWRLCCCTDIWVACQSPLDTVHTNSTLSNQSLIQHRKFSPIK